MLLTGATGDLGRILARDLGADQVNFKQCDVIRGEGDKGHGLFESRESKQVKQPQKALAKATRLGRKLGIRTTAFSFVPEKLPVCDQDPRAAGNVTISMTSERIKVPAHSISNRTSTVAVSTASPGLTCTDSTTASTGAATALSIFIDSRMISSWPR